MLLSLPLLSLLFVYLRASSIVSWSAKPIVASVNNENTVSDYTFSFQLTTDTLSDD